jgi:hypothetical protein
MITPKILNETRNPNIIGNQAKPIIKVNSDKSVSLEVPASKLAIENASSLVPQIAIQTGPPGPTGPSGSAPTLGVLLSGGTPLSGHRAVVLVTGIGMRYADPLSDDDAGAQVGILLQATSPGNIGNVQFSGILEEPSWSFENGPIFLGLNGVLTQVPISHGWVLVIARAITPTTIIIDPETPFWRE